MPSARLVALLTAASAFMVACSNPAGASGAGGGALTAGPGGVEFTISGETLAQTGYDFPTTGAHFIDGWEVRFSEVLVTVDHLRLWENPDINAGDQSQTGPLVAELAGPWAFDLQKGGPSAGKGGSGEEAQPFETLRAQNKGANAGQGFDPTSRYAFGFDVIPATRAAKRVNLDTASVAAYEEMEAKGYTVLYVGQASFRGTDCTPAVVTAADASTPPDELANLPPVVNFRLGFRSPTSYVNCQNPDLDPAAPLTATEEHERGLVTRANQGSIAQITIHTDHAFWGSFVHDSPAHFDMVAAQHAGEAGTPTANLEDMKGVDPTAITDKLGRPVPSRVCDGSGAVAGQLGFDPLDISVDPTGDPTTSIRDLYDFMTYNQSTQGHLNSDGLCAILRHYPSPP